MLPHQVDLTIATRKEQLPLGHLDPSVIGITVVRKIDRLDQLAPHVTLGLAQLDDLAVAHERLGEHAEAEALLRRSLQQQADRYETLANLGTVLIHDGRLAEGLALIERAVEINPDAHFGREWVQIDLVRSLIAQESTPPFSSVRAEEGVEEGLVGILAMGGPPHPAVFWSVAHALEASSDSVLALYARERVLELDPDWYASHARSSGMWSGGEPDVTREFRRMRAAADAWMADWHAWQRAELEAGRDPTTEAAWTGYLEAHPQPALSESVGTRLASWVARSGAPGVAVWGLLGGACVLGAGALCAIIGGWFLARRRRA